VGGVAQDFDPRALVAELALPDQFLKHSGDKILI
jgi:hypothetical protein